MKMIIKLLPILFLSNCSNPFACPEPKVITCKDMNITILKAPDKPKGIDVKFSVDNETKKVILEKKMFFDFAKFTESYKLYSKELKLQNEYYIKNIIKEQQE